MGRLDGTIRVLQSGGMGRRQSRVHQAGMAHHMMGRAHHPAGTMETEGVTGMRRKTGLPVEVLAGLPVHFHHCSL